MKTSNVPYDTPYMRLLAGIFLVLGGACSVYFIGLDVDGPQGTGVVPPAFQTQVLCFLATAVSLLYFAWPKSGHLGLVGVAVAALILGWTDASPVTLAIQLAVLAALLLPLAASSSFTRRASSFAKRAFPSTTVPDSVS